MEEKVREIKEILKRVDHTVLKATATWQEVREICEEAKLLHTASVCIPPSYVKRAAEYLQGEIAVCTVIGFPLGYQTGKVKLAETEEALENGAEEIDMVINLGDVKNGDFQAVEKEIAALKQAVGAKILKVIVETCYLTEEEKIKLCDIVTRTGADYIKTSTGFGTEGAVIQDVELFKAHIGPKVKVKAAGGIRTLEAAAAFAQAGADRLGTSALCSLAKEKISGK